ncbi:hypothetical protein O181_009984 [Austropuccinia psidii MF-1]|uniref:Small-subunit processome Utp21 domain-containing protein n=1 Tax=Austropuccinia psidii MF-1 TaxID=1389203 RepID=A0A9Q3BRR2_9BASI|nr:hypothetical protein [Austropuccinia psidii MF-1]
MGRFPNKRDAARFQPGPDPHIEYAHMQPSFGYGLPQADPSRTFPTCISALLMSACLYAPFRSLGHVTTDLPFAFHSHSTPDSDVLGPSKAHTDSQVILTSVGSAWALWSADGLRLLYIGPLTSTPITWLSVHHSGLILASAGDKIHIYKRVGLIGHLSTTEQKIKVRPCKQLSSSKTSQSSDEDSDGWIKEFKNTNSSGSSQINEFISFGNQVVALSACGKTLWVWNLDTRELHTTIVLPTTFGSATTLVHPSTYLNRVVVASQEGQLAIYNVQTGALVHIFQSTLFTTPTRARCKGLKVPITRIAQAPAVDILAVGFGDGWCSLVDVRTGEEMLAVKMGQAHISGGDSPGAITGIAFRSDFEAQLLVTCSSQGHVAIWDLNECGKLLHVILAAHDSAVSNIHFLPGQPVMVTASGDNSIKLWLFETPTGLPRLLTQRAGHQQPPHLIRYYGSDGKTILSAGRDRALRATSVVRDSRSFELSQGPLAKKATQLAASVSSLRMLPISDLSYSTSRSKDWDDLLTSHEGSSQAKSWSVPNKRIGKHSFSIIEKKSFQLDPPDEIARCVCVSACGNYGLVGTQGSRKIGMWNMQSGIKRKEFIIPPSTAKGKEKEMMSHVVGIATDALNQVVIVVTRSGHIYFFDFASSSHRHTVTLPCGAHGILLQRDSGMLAINCRDKQIRIIDIDTRRIIRHLKGFTHPISDITFTPDSRWLVACSTDSVIRTFDLPTSTLIDAFRTHSMATSITFSPTGDFLASAHTDSVGIFLWANRAQFAGFSYKSLPEDYQIPFLETPSFEGVEDDRAEEVERLLRPGAWVTDVGLSNDEVDVQQPLENGLITLSIMPKSKWQTLLNLEVIKARNKPKEPPKAPERAPFFLPSVTSAESRFNLDVNLTKDPLTNGKSGDGNKKRRLDLGEGTAVEVEFTRQLVRSAGEHGSYAAFYDYVRNLSPSALDLEIRSLSSAQHLLLLIQALIIRLEQGQDFEMVQAIMSVMLKVHGPRLFKSPHFTGLKALDEGSIEGKLIKETGKLLLAQEKATQKINQLVDYGIGVSAFIRGLTGVI